MTSVVPIDRDSPDPEAVYAAASVLEQGGLVVAQTETIYALLASAFVVDTLARAFDACNRPYSAPLPVMAADLADVESLARNIPKPASLLFDEYWPCPLTAVLLRQPTVSMVVTGGRNTIGVRVPGPSPAREIMLSYGAPIVCPPACLYGRRWPLSATDALEDLDGKVDLILDSGASPHGKPSTVIDLTSYPPSILREGVLDGDEILQFYNA